MSTQEIATHLLNQIIKRRPRIYPHIKAIEKASLVQLWIWFNKLRPPQTNAHIAKFELITYRIGELK